MKIIFIVPAALSHRTSEETLGVGYLSSILKQNNYEVKIIDAWIRNLDFSQLQQELQSEVTKDTLFIGISTYVSNIQTTSQIINYVKRKFNLPIVAGGFGPSFFPDKFLDIGVDIVSIGEGEKTILQICQFFENKIDINAIKGICYKDGNNTIYTEKQDLVTNLDELPFPKRDTMDFAVKRKSAVNVLSSRGCNGHCKFCSVIAFQKLSIGKRWRQRSIKNFVDEIEMLYKQGVKFFKVIDDSFIEHPRDEIWCKQLADEIESRGIKARFRGSITAEHVTENTLMHLKRAGFFSFACGVENFSSSVLQRYGKRASKQNNIKALNIFKKYNFYVQCGFILFDPYTTLDELRENLYYLKEYDWVLSKGIFTELYAAQGTVFTNELLLDSNTGELIQDKENYIYSIKDANVRSIYNALKHWQQSYDILYDLIVDPLIAPKNITERSMEILYSIYRTMRQKDIEMLEKLVKAKSDYDAIVDKELLLSKAFRDEIYKKGLEIYSNEQLNYDGTRNQYLFGEKR